MYDWACRQGLAALRGLDDDLQRRGLEILQSLEQENKVGVLLLGRPYHLDPGLNHGVLEEFQVLGYLDSSFRSGGAGPFARVEAVVDTNNGRPRIVYARDLTELGKGYNLQQQ